MSFIVTALSFVVIVLVMARFPITTYRSPFWFFGSAVGAGAIIAGNILMWCNLLGEPGGHRSGAQIPINPSTPSFVYMPAGVRPDGNVQPIPLNKNGLVEAVCIDQLDPIKPKEKQ